MVFIGTYKEADSILNDIESGTCSGRCRTVWRQHIRLALTKKTNPLKLTKAQKKSLSKKLKKIKGKRVEMGSKTRRQRGGDGMGQPLKYTDATHQEPSADAGFNRQGVEAPFLIRPRLDAIPMAGGNQILSPMSFRAAYHSDPMAPTGQPLTGLTLPATLRQGLNLGRMNGGRRSRRNTRRNTRKGGFFPSVMGGVVANAPLLAPLAARQGMRLMEEYRAATRRGNRKATRKSHRRRNSGRRA